MDETVTLTQELVRIRSENPTGNEAAVAKRIEAYLLNLGIDVERDAVEEGRDNLIAELGGASNKPALVFLNHMDTVPAGEGWTRDPFAAEISDGKMWGRGTCDMKGGLAAGLAAFKRLKSKADQGARLLRPVRCCLVVDEESSWMRGVSAAVEREWIGNEDLVLSCEPTSLELKSAQKGAMWYEAVFSGKSAHAASPENGADAIQAAAKMVLLLQEVSSGMDSSHSLLGRTTIVTSVIGGGKKTNIVADECRMEVDVRFIPPLGISQVRTLLEDTAAGACRSVPGTSAEIRVLSVDRPPVLSDPKSEGAGLIGEALREMIGVDSGAGGVSYYSDAGLAAARTGNRQCFLLGPGNIAQAHGPDEFVEIEELKKAALVFGRLAERFAFDK
ncbi:MAG: M20 family metallopeptidase [bacterium]